MATKLLNIDDILQNHIRQFRLFDDFTCPYLAAEQWTEVVAGATSATTILETGPGGQVKLLTDGAAQGNTVILHSTSEIFKVANDKPLFAIMRYKLVQSTAASHTAAFWFGVFDVV